MHDFEGEYWNCVQEEKWMKEYEEETFLSSCKTGNLEYIRSNINLKKNLNSLAKACGIILAAENRHFDIVQYLIERGFAKTISLSSALRSTIIKGYDEIFHYLLDKDNSLLLDDSVLNDILMITISYNRFEMMKQLLEKGGEIDCSNILKTACRYGYFEIVKYLVENGSFTNGNDCVAIAIKEGQYEIAKYLFDKGFVSRQTKKYKKYLSVIMKTRTRAQKKIYYWWIPICYDPNRAVGRRMMERSWEKYNEFRVNIKNGF